VHGARRLQVSDVTRGVAENGRWSDAVSRRRTIGVRQPADPERGFLDLACRRFVAGGRSRRYRRSQAAAAAEVDVSTQAEGTRNDDRLLAELVTEHRRIDERIKHLERQRSLTSAEQTEVAMLKKQKLLTKDRIARLSS
jgi:uncharacterized protein YdcH (DUF465 family)